MKARYVDEPIKSGFHYTVTFLNKDRVQLARDFCSPYLAQKFVDKLRHSKTCTLISYPIFR